MILSFKPQFVDKILDGTKIHTIREDPVGRWEPGKLIHFATGVRTKKYHCFKKGICIGTQKIKIHYGNMPKHYPDIYADNVLLSLNMVVKLALNDGFNTAYDFDEWFSKDFEGVIVHWTNFKY